MAGCSITFYKYVQYTHTFSILAENPIFHDSDQIEEECQMEFPV